MLRSIHYYFLFLLILIITTPAKSAELVSAKVCREHDYVEELLDCAAGKGLVGEGIELDHNLVRKIFFITVLRTKIEEDIYHIWFFKGERLSQDKPTLWSEREGSYIDDIEDELNWLRNQENIGPIQSIAAIVKLVLFPSHRFRTRSSKIITPEWVGPWKVLVYDEINEKPLRTIKFSVY